MGFRDTWIGEDESEGEDDSGEEEGEEHEGAVMNEGAFGGAAQTCEAGDDVAEGGDKGPGEGG